jgi:hypothetical protein
VRVSNSICRQDGSRRWPTAAATSQGKVTRVYKGRIKEYFVCKGGGLGLSYIACQTREQIKKKGPGELEPESRRRDDDA